MASTWRDGWHAKRRIFAGGSAGMAAWVALQVAAERTPGESLVVVLLPDTGERYSEKVHSDEWMRDNHLLDPSGTRVQDVVGVKSARLPTLHLGPASASR